MFTYPIALFQIPGSLGAGTGLNYCSISEDVLNTMKFTLSTSNVEFCTISSDTLRTIDWDVIKENLEYCAISQVGNGFENQVAQPVLSSYCASNFNNDIRVRPPVNLVVDYISNYCPRDFLNMVRVRPPINLPVDYVSNYCPRDFTAMERGDLPYLTNIIAAYISDNGLNQSSGLVDSWIPTYGNNTFVANSTTYNRPQVISNALGGKPVLSFGNGSIPTNLSLSSNYPFSNTGGYTVCALVKATGTSGVSSMVWDFGQTIPNGVGISYGTNVNNYFAYTPTSFGGGQLLYSHNYTNNDWVLLTFRITFGSLQEILINNVVVTSNSITTSAIDSTTISENSTQQTDDGPFVIGSQSKTLSIDSRYFVGQMAFLGIWREAVNNTNLNSIKQWLDEKFNLKHTNMLYYLDASDSSTITQSSNQVSQWRNKAGTSHLNQANSSQRPLTNTNTVNGLNVISFDGFNDWLQGNWGTLFNQTSDYTIAAIFTISTTNQNTQVLFRQTTGSIIGHDTCILYYVDVGNFYMANYNNQGNNTLQFSTRVQTEFGLNNLANIVILNKTGTSVYARTNGSIRISGTCDVNMYTADDPFYLTLGKNGEFETPYFNSNFCEFLVWKESLNQTRIEQLEGYAAHKWGFTSKLPTNHPYKSTNPNINPLYL